MGVHHQILRGHTKTWDYTPRKSGGNTKMWECILKGRTKGWESISQRDTEAWCCMSRAKGGTPNHESASPRAQERHQSVGLHQPASTSHNDASGYITASVVAKLKCRSPPPQKSRGRMQAGDFIFRNGGAIYMSPRIEGPHKGVRLHHPYSGGNTKKSKCSTPDPGATPKRGILPP